MESIWYIGLFIATVIENLIPPVPSEVIMPLAGYLAAQGKMNIILVILIGGLGSTLGTIPFFFLGKYITKHKIADWLDRYGKYIMFDRKKLDRLYDGFSKHDSAWVFWGRFLPGARSFISLPAGSSDMDTMRFFVLTYIGTTIWISIWALIGFFFGEHQELIIQTIQQYDQYMGYLTIALVVLFVIWFVNRPTEMEKSL